jgi:capsid assembly protease
MNILQVLNSPWAILPEKLLEIQAIYVAHVRGEQIDIAAIEARLGKPLNNNNKSVGYKIQDGVALLPIEGVISKRMNLFSQISGGVSTQLLQSDFAAAMEDPMAHSILQLVDSPGGGIDGLQQAANGIFAARGVKPVYAFADGLMASAAYWLGSAAEKVFSASDTTAVGSIGVIAQHVDYSKAQEKDGVKVTDIYAGKYKALGSKNAPLSDEGRAEIQSQVDHAYSVFVEAVARNRGVDAQTVLSKMADGRVFFGKQAVDAGLVDGISSVPDIIDQLNRRHRGASTVAPGAHASHFRTGTGDKDMATGTVAFLIAGASIATQAELEAAIKKITAEAKTEGVTAGATAERERIKAVEAAAQGFPGHDELLATLKFDGKTNGDQAATQILAAERTLRGDRLTALRKDAPKAADSSTPDPKKEKEQADAAAAGNSSATADPHVMAAKIAECVKSERAKGNVISFATASAIVEKAEKEKK